MSCEILDSVWSASGTRLIGDGVPAGNVITAQASLTHWDEWFPYWTGLGDTYERLAREALARGKGISLGGCQPNPGAGQFGSAGPELARLRVSVARTSRPVRVC